MDATGQRLDKWLCFARVVKSRTLAARLVEGGYVRVNGTRALSSSKSVSVGDVLTVALERNLRVLRILATAERRGPFREARLLFEELGEPSGAQPRGCDDPLRSGPLATSGLSE